LNNDNYDDLKCREWASSQLIHPWSGVLCFVSKWLGENHGFPFILLIYFWTQMKRHGFPFWVRQEMGSPSLAHSTGISLIRVVATD